MIFSLSVFGSTGLVKYFVTSGAMRERPGSRVLHTTIGMNRSGKDRRMVWINSHPFPCLYFRFDYYCPNILIFDDCEYVVCFGKSENREGFAEFPLIKIQRYFHHSRSVQWQELAVSYFY